MNNHPYAIAFIHKLLQEPTLETYATLQQAMEALKEYKRCYPENCYFLYGLLPVEEPKEQEQWT